MIFWTQRTPLAWFSRDSLGAAFRLIPYEIKDVDTLGLPPVVSDLARFSVNLPDELRSLIDGEEIEALAARAAAIVRRPVYPAARSARPYPWPLV